MYNKHIYRAYIGTNTKCGSKGIYHIELDTEQMEIKILNTKQILHGDYLVLSGDEKYLYAASEAVYFKGKATGGATAFRIEQDGSLTFLNSENTKGQMACFCCIDSKRKNFYTAEYMGGYVTVFDIKEDGSLLPYRRALGHSPKSEKHWPSTHSVIVTPDDKYILATDVGLDLISLYDREREYACVTELEVSGRPRQAAFSKDGRFLYVSTEQSGVVYVCAYFPDEEKKLKVIQTVSTVPEDWKEYHAETSAIKVSPDGRMLCVANRAFSLNDISCFEIDQRTGKIVLRSRTKLKGFFPRDFNFTPDGRYLLVGMQFSDQLELCEVDTIHYQMRSVKLFDEIPRCNCVQFLKGEKEWIEN